MSIRSIFILFVCSMVATACVTEGGGRPRRQSDEEAARANLNLGVGYLNQGRPEVAVEALQRAVDLDPRLAEAHSVLGLGYEMLENFELAETHHRRATQLDSDNPDAQNRYAVFLCRQDRWSEARRYFDRAIDNPRYRTPEVAITNAGTCAKGADDLASAERYFRQALGLNAENVDALEGMLDVSLQNENYLQGRAFMQRLFAASTPSALHLLLCYSIERALNDSDAAGDCAAQLRAQYPGSPELGRLRELEQDGG
jgi:type IV pilus assembly protein PilF